MRIVIDMQGAQTESRYRGIGRYTLSFTQAVVRNRGQHEIILALSGLFPDTIEPIRAAFDGILPQENIRVWHALGPVDDHDSENESRRIVAELLREEFLQSLQPDVIHINSLFEGFSDNAVTSIRQHDLHTPISVIYYDSIPLIYSNQYFDFNQNFKKYYFKKLSYQEKATIHLSISEFSREEGLTLLNIASNNIINISTAIESFFKPLHISKLEKEALEHKIGITKPVILYTGGADIRKNLPRLIEAFAALPQVVRESHQLLFAGKIPDGNMSELRACANLAGLLPHELLFSGYVSDIELVQLYNLCKLFVFPSWHEGFGLPALEAMACGAAVIGANTASLPEVIGLEAAMFDPFDVDDITAHIAHALQDNAFRATLRQSGRKRAKLFSWDASAQRALEAWAALGVDGPSHGCYVARSTASARLMQAMAPHLPTPGSASMAALSICLAQNQSAGIERQLLLDVSELSQRDSATGVQRVVRSYLKELLLRPPTGYRVEPVFATQTEGYRYARHFTQRFLEHGSDSGPDDPIQWQRGDLFFGLDMQHHVQLAQLDFYKQLRLDGVIVKWLVYDLLPIQLPDLFKDSNAKDLHEQWLDMVGCSDGAICISHATADAYGKWLLSNNFSSLLNFQLAGVHIGADIDGSKPSHGLPSNAGNVMAAIRSRITFLCVSTIEPRKGQVQIVEALDLLWSAGLDVNLVLVGQQGWKVDEFAQTLLQHPENGQRLFWLKGISDAYLQQVYAASSCLIAASLNEGFGLSLVEAALHGMPIVARDIPVFREVASEFAYYFAGSTPQDLATAINNWYDLYRVGLHPQSNQLSWSTWHQSAEKLKTALIDRHNPRKQWLVDISELVQRDARSGIQRVVRSILREWLLNPPDGYRVEPIFATLEHGYHYARNYTNIFLGGQPLNLPDLPIDYAPGDIFFGLDLQPQVVASQRESYQDMRRQGVHIEFLLHDLLCLQMPEYFPPGTAEGFSKWLECITENDGVVCVSQTVATELSMWMVKNNKKTLRPLKITWSHNGADIDNSTPSTGLPSCALPTLEKIKLGNSFLMVGTLEPRKGHSQVLDAFEDLWAKGATVNLVIVGKQGWLVESLVERLQKHQQLGQHLFWLDGISDEYLELLYAASKCLIAASYGEGFGLPLIEAAQHKLPIIARDIPVFREVMGNNAFYFTNENTT
ncbi:MAG: glycosyltransferase family 1 protein, partial [Rhodoferax sp.]|nr:glycosyltransferase family 1 protein [Rhodoferax sp.]